MQLDPIEILKELVAIPSVSPSLGEATRFVGGEARLTGFLEKFLTQIGLTVWRQPVLPGRENVIARLDGDVQPTQGGSVILLDAHQDTVPVDGMTIKPFQPEQRDGRIYGRGACDVKGGMAAILAAVARLTHEQPRPLPTIIVSCTVDEENGFCGARRLIDLWADGGNGFIPRRPDAAIVLEPTGLNLVVAHKGVVRWRVHAHGRAAHSSCPEAGENAIYTMARTITAIEQYAANIANTTVHPRCGRATVNVGTIHGGAGVNTVPDRCTIEIDYRPLPGEELDAVRQRLLDHVAHSVPSDSRLEHELPFMQGQPLSDEHNGSLAERLFRVVREVVGSCRQMGVPYCTNAPFYASAGIPTVVFGPGSLEQAHTADEWLPVDQLLQATDILYHCCRTFPTVSTT
jgi:acetylornithine deacetylase